MNIVTHGVFEVLIFRGGMDMVNVILRNFIKLSIPRERKLFIDIIIAQDHILKQKSRPTEHSAPAS